MKFDRATLRGALPLDTTNDIVCLGLQPPATPSMKTSHRALGLQKISCILFLRENERCLNTNKQK